MHMANLSRVDLNLLVVLDAIVTEGGVSRAATQLNLTQPAVSHALARLRELFDDPLFVREGRNLVPTSLTKRLIEPLRQSLLALGALIEKGESFDPARSETSFMVSMRDPMEVLILPRMMRRLAREAPGIDLRTVQVRRAASRPAWPTARSMLRSMSPAPVGEDPSPARGRRPLRGRSPQGPSACTAGLHTGDVSARTRHPGSRNRGRKL